MTIQETLEAHHVWLTLENRLQCKACGLIEGDQLTSSEKRYELKLAHVAEVLDKHMQEREAGAVRETSRYLQRIFPRKGLLNRADILSDIEIAADRIGRGLHANGREKADTNGR